MTSSSSSSNPNNNNNNNNRNNSSKRRRSPVANSAASKSSSSSANTQSQHRNNRNPANNRGQHHQRHRANNNNMHVPSHHQAPPPHPHMMPQGGPMPPHHHMNHQMHPSHHPHHAVPPPHPHMMHQMPPGGPMPPHMMHQMPPGGPPPHHMNHQMHPHMHQWNMPPQHHFQMMQQQQQQQQRQFSSEEMQRKIFVGNLPDLTTEPQLREFFSSKVGPVKNVQLKSQKRFAFVEFHSKDHVKQAIANLDETLFLGQRIRVRSTDKNRSKSADQNNPHRLLIKYIPQAMSEKDIRGLFETLGPLKHFHLVMDNQTQKSKGYAFCEYVDPSNAQTAIERLHGTEILQKRLVVQRANEKQNANIMKFTHSLLKEENESIESILTHELKHVFNNLSHTPTNVVHLLNMFDPEEFKNNQEKIEQLGEEVLAEADRYGNVNQLVVPIPHFDPDGKGAWKDGFGRMFIQYDTVQEAQNALNGMTGRLFHGRLVISSFFPESDLNKALENRSFEFGMT